jgi:CubicO group peptidase (beta-lactamase class C family)
VKCLFAFVLFGARLTLLGADSWDKPDPTGAGMSAEKLAAIPLRMQEFVNEGKTAGTITIVARHGKVASFDAVGYQDLQSKTPMKRNSMFQIMSLTKPVTCAAIMVLADEGKLSVIDPVERYLPEYKGLLVNGCSGRSGYGCDGVAPSRPITIEDLMAHTSGMSGNVEIPPGESPSSLADLARLGSQMRLLYDPGTHWNYSNLGYDVLGRIIEVIANQPYDLFLKERIFDPLNMKDTYFFVPATKLSRVATVYTLTANGLKPVTKEPPPTIPRPAGGLVSTAADMLRFNLMMLNKGTLGGHRVLSAAAVELMTTSHTGDMPAGWSPGVGHGYGYEVVRDSAGMFRYNSIGSYVKGGAYRTYEWVDPQKDLAGVLMMQLTNGGGDTADEINRFLQISAAAIE